MRTVLLHAACPSPLLARKGAFEEAELAHCSLQQSTEPAAMT